MWLGLSGRFRARWSPQIHDEWKRNLLANREDLTREQLDRTSDLMDRAIPDALVLTTRHLPSNYGYRTQTTGTYSPPPFVAAPASSSPSTGKTFRTTHWHRSASRPGTPTNSSTTCSTRMRPLSLPPPGSSARSSSIRPWMSTATSTCCNAVACCKPSRAGPIPFHPVGRDSRQREGIHDRSPPRAGLDIFVGQEMGRAGQPGRGRRAPWMTTTSAPCTTTCTEASAACAASARVQAEQPVPEGLEGVVCRRDCASAPAAAAGASPSAPASSSARACCRGLGPP